MLSLHSLRGGRITVLEIDVLNMANAAGETEVFAPALDRIQEMSTLLNYGGNREDAEPIEEKRQEFFMPGVFRDVLRDLIANARKYTPAGPTSAAVPQ